MSDDRTTMADLGYSESLNPWGGGGTPGTMSDGDAPRYYGKYRGSVVNNVDPKRQNRLLVQVVDVLGMFTSSWALPCLPIGGVQFGAYLVPPIGAGVWVEFEQGKPSKPIWTGFFSGTSNDSPGAAQSAVPGSAVMIFGTAQASVTISDVPISPMKGAGVMLKSGSTTLVVDTAGVQINGTSIQVTGSTNINNGALTVTT